MACSTGPSKIIRGIDKILNLKITNSAPPKDPYDMSDVDKILVQFPGDSETLKKWRLAKTGNTTNASDLISNIDTTDIEEGEKITGTGIPVGATVLYTPASASPNAQPANTIKISTPATATGTGVALVIGDVEIVGNALLGKLKVTLSESETEALKIGANQTIEVLLQKDGVTDIVPITSAITVEKSQFEE